MIRRRLAIVALILALYSVAAGAQRALIFTGSDEVTWAAVGDETEWSLLVKHPGRSWEQHSRHKGTIAAAAAVGPQLYVLYETRDLVIYDAGSPKPLTALNPRLSQWPAESSLVSLASSLNQKIPSPGDAPFRVLALVARPAGAQNETANDEQIRTPDSTRRVTLGLAGYTGRSWTFLTDVATVDLAATTQTFLAVRNGMVYVVLTDSDGQSNRIYRVLPGAEEAAPAEAADEPAEEPDRADPNAQADQARDRSARFNIESIQLSGPLARQRILGAIVLEDQIVLPLALAQQEQETPDEKPAEPNEPDEADGREEQTSPDQPAETEDPPTGDEEVQVDQDPQAGKWTVQMVLLGALNQTRLVALQTNDQAVEFPSIPAVARDGSRIALLWQDEGTWQIGQSSLNGKFLPEGSPEVFAAAPPDRSVQKVWEYVMWGVAIAALTLVLLRPRRPIQPFSLPKGVRPASPLLRLIAFLIDQMPWMVVAIAIFAPDPAAVDDLQGAIQGKYPSLLYASLTGLLLYIVYAAILEYRFQATLGKKLLKLKVVHTGASRPSLQACFLRNVIKIIELSLPLGFFPILLFVPFLSRYRQRIGDMLAYTTVIDARTADLAQPDDPHRLPGADESIRKHESDDAQQEEADGEDPDRARDETPKK
ncbi:MAG: RDD family protein [Phycisphaerae bacterium]